MSTLSDAILNLDENQVMKLVRERNEAGSDPMAILNELQRGMEQVGERFQEKDYFLSELIIAGQLFQDAMGLIEPRLRSEGKQEKLGTMVMATLKGDIHDIGKNIARTLLKAAGFEVFDLGVDVPVEKLIKKVVEVQPQIVGFSALITPSFHVMKEAVDQLREMGLRENLKIIIGGGVTTEMARTYVGADAQVVDAVEGVNICKKFVQEER